MGVDTHIQDQISTYALACKPIRSIYFALRLYSNYEKSILRYKMLHKWYLFLMINDDGKGSVVNKEGLKG